MAPLEPTCDACDAHIVGVVYKACLTRPSDPRALVSVMWACAGCAPALGARPDEFWEAHAEAHGLDYEG